MVRVHHVRVERRKEKRSQSGRCAYEVEWLKEQERQSSLFPFLFIFYFKNRANRMGSRKEGLMAASHSKRGPILHLKKRSFVDVGVQNRLSNAIPKKYYLIS
jgi:hypothetical protein